MIFEGIDVQWAVLAPLIALFVTAAFGVLFALLQTDSRSTALVSLIGIATAAVFNLNLFMQAQTGTEYAAFGMRFLGDTAALGFNFVILLGTALAVLVSYDYLRRADLEQPEYYPLMLLSATGAMVMAGAGDLITLVLGLEILSLAVYVLSAWRQGARESEEAGMKYFLLGAFASAFLIYGAALVFGATGSFTYGGIVGAIAADGFGSILLASLGGFFVLGGLAFKASIAPFHQWAPDVYTGAPTPVTTYMSVVVKTAAFAALLRIAVAFFPNLMPGFVTTFAVLVGLTMIVGNFAALLQSGVKRMLAYSAVAHAGYLGLAVLAADTVGTSAAGWYLLAYTLMNAGAFAVLTLISDASDRGDDLERFAGLGRTRPALALAFTIFLLSLTGIPPLAGFTGKVLVFQAAIVAGYAPLAVIGILTSVVAAVYYFRVIAYMYFREQEYEPLQNASRVTGWTVGFAAAATVLLGILPGWWYQLLGAGRDVLARL
jgi:NADH-quinone oxidoreductase subunit N